MIVQRQRKQQSASGGCHEAAAVRPWARSSASQSDEHLLSVLVKKAGAARDIPRNTDCPKEPERAQQLVRVSPERCRSSAIGRHVCRNSPTAATSTPCSSRSANGRNGSPFPRPGPPFDRQRRDIPDPRVRHPILRAPTNSPTRDDSRSSPIPAVTIRHLTRLRCRGSEDKRSQPGTPYRCATHHRHGRIEAHARQHAEAEARKPTDPLWATVGSAGRPPANAPP